LTRRAFAAKRDANAIMNNASSPSKRRSPIRKLIALAAFIVIFTATTVCIVRYFVVDQSVVVILPHSETPPVIAPVSRIADVTAQIRAKVADNSLSLQVDNDTFGFPPGGGTESLQVRYTIDGSPGVRTVKEGRHLSIKAAPGKKLIIQRARYGILPPLTDVLAAGDIGPASGIEDVTGIIRKAVANNAFTTHATNTDFGDPAPFVVKTLRVQYTIDGSPGVRSAKENQTLIIAASPGKKLEIQNAVYGDLPDLPDKIAAGDVGPQKTDTKFDVTQLLQKAVINNSLTIVVGNDSMGGDPAFGVVKRLTVQYTVAGKPHTATANEGDTLNIPTRADGGGVFVIVKAAWGPPG
jgi:Domain of unknown function (DUF3395)